MTVRTVAQAVAWAKTKRHGYGGLCLAFSRTAYNVPGRYGWARQAWQNAQHKHQTSSWAHIPIGAPIFFDSPHSTYGHVAIYVGGGKIATTHASTGWTAVDNISTWTGAYGYHMLGWTEDINGVRVLPASSSTTAATSKYKVTAKAGVNARVKPNTSAKVHRTLKHGETFTVRKGSGTVKGSGHRWLKTTTGYYIAYDYVKKVS